MTWFYAYVTIGPPLLLLAVAYLLLRYDRWERARGDAASARAIETATKARGPEAKGRLALAVRD